MTYRLSTQVKPLIWMEAQIERHSRSRMETMVKVRSQFKESPVNRSPPPAPVQSSGGGSIFGGIGSTIAQGMTFGTGSVVAHRAVDSIMGPHTIQHETVGAAVPDDFATNTFVSDACGMHSKAFTDVFLDVVESVNMLVNSNGQIVRSEVVGALKMRTYLRSN
ncbi:unnamed protein product [Lactuca virosa]|uniref:MHD domain-containing protein n=1 Tax=Lactuca virosa TaxID=75947 RepID=A0AAU9LX82_9ASTR|nr:unnamed protein product [Lactuca virosa]